MKVGILGGTFDPLHIGHLVAAMNAQSVLELDKVLMVVAHQPWQKVGTRRITPAAVRWEMVASAVADLPGIEASTIEMDRGGDSYTIDTVETLQAENPDDVHYLIIGSDVADQLESWHRHQELAELVTVAIVERPGTEGTRTPPGWSVESVPAPLVDLSSTELRQRIDDGRPVRFLIPDAASMIYRHYREQQTGNA